MLFIKPESKNRLFQCLPNLRLSADAAVGLLHVWFVNTSLNDGKACCSGQLCGNGDGDGFPSWSVKGPLWSYLDRLLRFHCRTPLRQQQLSCSPALAPTRGELRPQSEAWRKTFFTRSFFGGNFVEVFVLTCKVTYHLLCVENEKKLNWRENVSSPSPDWKTYKFWMAYWQYWFTWLLFCCFFLVLPFARWTWALWQSSSGCFTYVYWFGSPKYCLTENSFHSKQRSENMSDCVLNLQNKNQIKYSFRWEYLWLIINSGL